MTNPIVGADAKSALQAGLFGMNELHSKGSAYAIISSARGADASPDGGFDGACDVCVLKPVLQEK